MALPKAKKTGVTGASSRLRRAGPVPAIVYGDPKATDEGERAELFARLKREAALPGQAAETALPAGFEPMSLEKLFDIALEELRSCGYKVPDDPSRLGREEAKALMAGFDVLMAEMINVPKALEKEFRPYFESRVFGHGVGEGVGNPSSVASEASRKEKAIMAMADVAAAAQGFGQAIFDGSLSFDDLPYVARKRLSEICRSLDGESIGDPDREAELQAQLVAQQAEILRLRSSVPLQDAELAALEAEVAAMVERGRAPEIYGERADKRELSIAFLRRVYGKYLEKGREAIFLHQIRKLDYKFVEVLTKACLKEGVDIGDLVPRKSARTDRIVSSLGLGQKAAFKALEAVRTRNRKKVTGG